MSRVVEAAPQPTSLNSNDRSDRAVFARILIAGNTHDFRAPEPLSAIIINRLAGIKLVHDNRFG
jgi:hypothetical protein